MYVLYIVVCPFVPFLLAIVLSVSFDIRILITPLVSSNSFYVLVTYVFTLFDAGKRFLFFFRFLYFTRYICVGKFQFLNNIVLLRDVFHIGLIIGPRTAVLA